MDWSNIILTVINIIFVFIVVLGEHKNPTVTWAWLLVVIIIPIFGFLLYLVIGLNGGKLKYFARKNLADKKISKEFHDFNCNGLEYAKENEEYYSCARLSEEDITLHELVRLNSSMDDAHLTSSNKVRIYNRGEDKFADLIKDIEAAKTYIHLEYYIVRDDNVANKLINVMAKKAREGVEVKFLVDKMGTFFVEKKNFKRITNAGGEVAYFDSPSIVNLNYRNHRKLSIIDGKIGYIGGLNVGDEYLGKVKRFGHWRDSHIRVYGDSVKEMELRFIKDWNYISNRKVKITDRYFPKVQGEGDVFMQIVSSGPDTDNDNILIGFLKMIADARKSVYIVTPYFVPDESLVNAMLIASKSGIDVKLIIPKNPDHLFVYGASISYITKLLDYGVECYQYNRGFIHSKMLIVDGEVTSIGSANMDIRSFKLNFEANSFIYSKNVAQQFIQLIELDIMDSEKITREYLDNKSFLFRIRVAICKLVSPLL